ncbi:class I SAM-dependent DNA methyltransferase [Pseudohongiella sp.]|uniref:Methyltransferase domain-containing protein n=1 Tax=marine sediment metagenome TaxID=412755 RepID=A0A0F9YQC2_9ZZZZ|nr:class I SAM-dependent methyltransferase [Pseudohongiella sp.]HDZ10077.1 class I SAM-dependent methyltransferase [Pseudohongiella sp.]HEA63426.1 class I SAM-dependent methyltransferase [Pseudohongiella sp.]
MDPVKETINTFDKYAVEYESRYMNHAPYVETYRLLSELLSADAVILDAACGPGNIASFLLQGFPDRKLHGIDLSAKMVARARLNNPAATFDVMDCRKISTLHQHYDAIVAGFCFPYLSRREVRAFISDARNRLNADGVFYISFMAGDYTASGLQTRNDVDWVCTYYHDPELVIETLEATGFEVIDLDRKTVSNDGEPDTIDIFIYARMR